MANNQNEQMKLMGDMPHSLEAEQALLGCLLLDTRIQVEVAAFLKEEDFYAESHKYIFSAMESIIKKNQPVDLVTLTDALEKQGALEQAGGITYIAELTNVMPSSANYQRYLDIVTRDSLLRKLIKGSAEIIGECKTSVDKATALSFAEKTVYDISNEADTSEIIKISKVVDDVVQNIEELASGKKELQGIRTGFRGLDGLLNGLHKSDLMILAARPAVGKTSFAMNIVENVAMQGYSCAVFSLEMGKEQITERLLCSIAGVSMGNTKRGKVEQKEWIKFARARELLLNAKIFIDDSAVIRPRELISKCRRLKSRFGLDFVMVDYMQLMTPDKTRSSDSRQNEITEISRSLKILAKELNVPVLALSQLSRAVETRKGRPQLSDLRESGAIEQDADIVMFIHRPDKNATEKEIADGKVIPNVAEILIEKHRSGPTGMVKLYFKGECTKFLNLNEETGEPDEDGTASKVTKPVATVTGYEDLPEAPPEEQEPIEEQAPIIKSVDDEIF
ncbi:MAG: replicative DNA helicase [Clostridia bacterium]|nr:replicative DNA helicase [Clostridia bacterium]